MWSIQWCYPVDMWRVVRVNCLSIQGCKWPTIPYGHSNQTYLELSECGIWRDHRTNGMVHYAIDWLQEQGLFELMRPHQEEMTDKFNPFCLNPAFIFRELLLDSEFAFLSSKDFTWVGIIQILCDESPPGNMGVSWARIVSQMLAESNIDM